MNQKLAKTTAIGASLALLFTVLVVFTPPAAAQGSSMTVKVTIAQDGNLPNSRLLPETGEARPKVKVTVDVAALGVCVIPITLTYKIKSQPAYANVILNPAVQTISVVTNSNAPTTGATTTPFNAPDVEMIVTTKRDAPAFEDGKYEVQVDANGGQATGQETCNVPDATGTGASTVKNDYLPLTVVNPSSLYVKAGQNKKVVFPVELQNLGNGPTRIKVEATQPNKNKLDAINVGAEVRLESRAGKGPSALFKQNRNIEVQTPHANGYTNSIYQFNVKFTSQFDGAATGTLAQDEQTVAFSVQVQGVYVPGFDPTLLIGALGIGLIVLRRRNA